MPGRAMAASAVHHFAVSSAIRAGRPPSILVGVTHAHSCLLLTSRLRAFREAGFRVTLVASPGRLLAQTAAKEGLEAIAIPMRRTIAPLADLISLLRLWRLLGRCRPDLVEFSTPKAGLLGSFAARLRGVPSRVYMLRGLRLETSKGLKRRILVAAERLAASCAHVVLCNSESLRAEALALGLAPREKLHLLGDGSSNGVDIDRFSPGPTDVRERMGVSRAAPVIGFVGRLTRDKGVPELIEAFESILLAAPEARLLLVGWFDDSEDALQDEICARIQGHPRIHLTGFVGDPAPYYRAMDLMVLPTRREGFPNAVLEAAASGVPVVTTFSTGARDSVVPEVTGLLVAAGSAKAISEAALKLLANRECRLRMGEAARAWVTEHYLDERVLGLTSALYRSLLKRDIQVRRAPAQ